MLRKLTPADVTFPRQYAKGSTALSGEALTFPSAPPDEPSQGPPFLQWSVKWEAWLLLVSWPCSWHGLSVRPFAQVSAWLTYALHQQGTCQPSSKHLMSPAKHGLWSQSMLLGELCDVLPWSWCTENIKSDLGLLMRARPTTRYLSKTENSSLGYGRWTPDLEKSLATLGLYLCRTFPLCQSLSPAQHGHVSLLHPAASCTEHPPPAPPRRTSWARDKRYVYSKQVSKAILPSVTAGFTVLAQTRDLQHRLRFCSPSLELSLVGKIMQRRLFLDVRPRVRPGYYSNVL